ncbi:MAG: phosphotransferase enzyme family protein [Rhizobiaceae bacterium]
MNDKVVQEALALWRMDGAKTTLAANRENAVYQAEIKGKKFAIRLHRTGYRTRDELTSELDWMAELSKNGLLVPIPVEAKDGAFCHLINGIHVDVLTWLKGEPMGREGKPARLPDADQTYHALGRAMARLHKVSDEWQQPDGFTRPSWDIEGLVGEAPVWGRFWDNQALSKRQVEKFSSLRIRAHNELTQHQPVTDFGLIHADLVPDNVLVDGATVKLIDFDDGGFGFRLFDIATTLNKAAHRDSYDGHRKEFLSGYQSVKEIDLELLPLFQALRALTYVGWIVPRIAEKDAASRNYRFISAAEYWCDCLESGS